MTKEERVLGTPVRLSSILQEMGGESIVDLCNPSFVDLVQVDASGAINSGINHLHDELLSLATAGTEAHTDALQYFDCSAHCQSATVSPSAQLLL